MDVELQILARGYEDGSHEVTLSNMLPSLFTRDGPIKFDRLAHELSDRLHNASVILNEIVVDLRETI